jgi:hypothetical protein
MSKSRITGLLVWCFITGLLGRWLVLHCQCSLYGLQTALEASEGWRASKHVLELLTHCGLFVGLQWGFYRVWKSSGRRKTLNVSKT